MKAPWERLYHLKRWERRSALQRQEHPLCKMCLEHGVVREARVADHVIPHKGDEQKFWFGELQSLCLDHHNASKQQEETLGYTKDIGSDGWPVDPRHYANTGKLHLRDGFKKR